MTEPTREELAEIDRVLGERYPAAYAGIARRQHDAVLALIRDRYFLRKLTESLKRQIRCVDNPKQGDVLA